MTPVPHLRPITRRAALGGLAVLLGTASASAQATIAGASGRVTAATFPALESFVTDNLDQVVSMDITLDGAEAQGFTVQDDAGLLIAYTRGGKFQFSVTRGFTRRGSSFAVEGFYQIRYAGMRQGIEAYALEPAPAPSGARAEVRRLG